MRSGEDRLPPIVLYHYSETRAGEHAADFLKGIADGTYVMVDGYSGYNKLKRSEDAVVTPISGDI